MATFDFRRTKILILVLLLFALNTVYKVNGLKERDLIQFTKKSEIGDEGLCVAFNEEVYSAIEWSYPIPEDEDNLPEIVSSYFPTNLSSSFNYKFEEDQQHVTWAIENWSVETHTSNNYIPIMDARWEDFRLLLSNSNKTKMIENRVEIPRNASIGISIRSDSTVNILLCEGYNPDSFACYVITLGGNSKKEVYITKYGMEKNLTEYKSEYPILSADEWKNFQLTTSEKGHIQLKKVDSNTTYVDIIDPSPLNTLYILINSSSSALWKVHKNNFLFTNTSQYVPFGPPINSTSSTICLSMYLMLCKSCSIYFYTNRNISKEIVLEIPQNNSNTIENKWEHIRLIIENVTGDSEQLYVKTHGDALDKFWAIDNVRICTVNEFKVNKLSKGHSNQKLNFDEPTLSCHLLKAPGWRPKKQVLSSQALPIVEISSNITSMELSWKTASQQPYLIKYKGFDICDEDTIPQYKNKQRLKSNGWIIVKPKQTSVTIKNLIPYTHYEISLFDPIYESNKSLSNNTSFTEKPAENELPLPNITRGTNKVEIHLPQRKCNISYGSVMYELDIIQKSNRSKPLYGGSSYIFQGLEAYTNYTISIKTARTTSNLKNVSLSAITYLNFTTKPDVAPPIEATLYESSQNSMSFRYLLPNKPKGVPKRIQLAVCNSLTPHNCTSKIENITHCDLWKNMYCISINNLMKKTAYTFKLSIKNDNTNSFGKDLVIFEKTVEKVPGKPTNVSYKVIDCSDLSEYCNLNISWWHPYNQGGVISSFEIFLQHEKEVIMDNVLIKDKQYLPVYWHIVKNLSYAKIYSMTIRATNGFYKGSNVTSIVKTDHIAEHIDQIPKFLNSNGTEVVFQVPKLDYRLNSSIILVIVQKNESANTNIPQNLISLANNDLCLYNKSSWIAGIWKASSGAPVNEIIGNGTNLKSNIINDTITNTRLIPDTEYCVNFVITTVYKNKTHVKVYHEKHIMVSEAPQDSDKSTETMSTAAITVLILLILLIISVISFVVYRIRKQRREKRLRRSYGENIYESMPSDDLTDFNVVYNAMYDKLSHE